MALMDTPNDKRRSLPPLGLSVENEASSPNRRRGKPKKKLEVSNSQQSVVNRNATSEEQGNPGTDLTDGRKQTRKKKRPTSGFDPESGEGENMEDNVPINSSKTSNGAARRKKVESSARMARIQRSVSDDGLASTEIPKTSGKKRRRPRSKLIESGDEDGVTPTGRPPAGRGKTKRKKTPKLPGSGDDDYLADGEAMSTIEFLVSAEDVVTEDRTADNQPITVTTLPSQPIPRLFMERKDGFKSEDKAKMAKRRQKEEMPQPMTSKTTTEVAIATHKMSLTLSLYCHGLLAGFALWQCIVVYSLSQKIPSLPFDGNTSFLIHYSSLAQPTATIYYLLLALCTVSIFDRFDIARPDKRLFRALLTFKSGAVAIVLYFLALVFNIGLAAVDDRISLFTVTGEDVNFCVPQGHEEPLWQPDETDSRLAAWRGVNLVRALLSMFGWLLLALAPSTDFTAEHLYDSEEPLWEEQQQTELNQVQSSA